MTTPSVPRSDWRSAAGGSPDFQRALMTLAGAYAYAQEQEQNVWDFAVELQTLHEAGLTPSGLRWLACQGLVEHAPETTRPGALHRSFGPVEMLHVTERTCVVLTARGAELVRQLDASPQRLPSPGPPRWVGSRRQLWLGPLLVKEFRQPADCQERILAAFEEEGWPARIDDPLPPQSGSNPKQHLHDTITCLNRPQRHPLLHFGGDGTGCGVCWRLRR
jgi:hypothetical protein